MSHRSDLEDKVGRALVRMIRRAEEAQERSARQHGMHPTDFRCISFLKARAAPTSAKEIIAYLGLTSGAGTALLDRLESVGFIQRTPNPDDRRGILIVLDENAAAQPIALYQRIQREYAAATSALSDDNLEAIATYLTRIHTLSEQMNAALYDDDKPVSTTPGSQQKEMPSIGLDKHE